MDLLNLFKASHSPTNFQNLRFYTVKRHLMQSWKHQTFPLSTLISIIFFKLVLNNSSNFKMFCLMPWLIISMYAIICHVLSMKENEATKIYSSSVHNTTWQILQDVAAKVSDLLSQIGFLVLGYCWLELNLWRLRHNIESVIDSFWGA